MVLAKYLKGHDLFVPGDIRGMELSEFKILANKKIVEETTIADEWKGSTERMSLKGFNILGKKYRTDFIDVVIPTKDIENVKSLEVLKKAEKSGSISLNIIERSFNDRVGGFAKACNDGAKLNSALGEYILFLNDDVEVGTNFFADLLLPFKDESVAMVGADCSRLNTSVNGSVLCVRREVFESVGGFDEDYFFMWEDNDLCQNIKRRGWKIEISKAEAKHEGKDSLNNGSEFWRTNYFNGKNKFDAKWMNGQRVIGSMIVGNESGRYMSRVITDLFKRNLIDEMVVVCDDSDPETIAELDALKKFYPIDIKVHEFKLFGEAENILRERSIDYAISKNPFGIIPIDADEFLDEELSRKEIIELLNKGVGWDFPIVHFWGDEKKCRVDGVFGHQKNVRLFRYLPDRSQKFFEKNLHCGSCPIYGYSARKTTKFVLKHLGYVRPIDIQAKKERQLKHDPKMLLEDATLYEKMVREGECREFSKEEFLKGW